MGRTIDNRNIRRPKPVERIELSEKNVRIRMVAAVALLVFGAAALSYSLVSFLGSDSGWQEIHVSSSADVNCSDEFVFLYNLGSSGMSATAENKVISALYTEAAVYAYRLFSNDRSFDGLQNVYDINRHPNEVLQVDDVLYQAFSVMASFGRRDLYLAPIYSVYDNLFYCVNDTEAMDFDPYRSEAVRSYFDELITYLNDPEAVELQLLGDGNVRLNVSQEYLEYAQENDVTDFIDFFWMKNAFIIDYLADVMIENNHTLGSFSSYDGFIRNLDDSGTSYTFNVYDRAGQTIYPAAAMQYSNPMSIVYLRNYPMNSLDTRHYYELANGEIRTMYIDAQDGNCKSAVHNLVSYSGDMGCAEILMRMIPIYIADVFEEDKVADFVSDKVYSIYCKDSVIYYNDTSLVLSDLYDREGVSYKISFVEEK